MGRPLRAATACSASTVVRPDPRRRAHAEAWLEHVLEGWGLEPALGGRWLVAADTHLRLASEITLAARFDPRSQVFTFEIWHGHLRIYGIDDWLG